MRVFFVLDDDEMFHPKMLDTILSHGGHRWIGVCLTSSSIMPYMKRHVLDIGFATTARLAWKKIGKRVFGSLFAPITGRPATVAQVARKHGVPCRKEDKINSPEFLEYLKSLAPDLIVASTSRIFRAPILDLPAKGCINRHSALLPSYGGVLPVFQAVAHREAETGVSIHYMDETIDTGRIIAQKAFALDPSQGLHAIYETCFQISAELILEALEIIDRNIPLPDFPERPKSYYSFPDQEDWARFKAAGGRFL